MLFAANCGSGGGNSNPPLPVVKIAVTPGQVIDVGSRYYLDGSGTTDPNGDEADLEFIWRITSGGVETTDFDDHCREDFDEICVSNDDDHCSNDLERICKADSDCEGLGQCLFNSGTSSSECTVGICGIGEGEEGAKATFVAKVAGPYSVRLTADGTESTGTKTIVVNTYPSLFVTDSLLQFGGTEGAFLGAVEDAPTYVPTAIQGAFDPLNEDLLAIDGDLRLIRAFDLRTGKIVGTFGETDRFLNVPTAMAFNPEDGRLYVAEAGGRVVMFDGSSGLLVAVFVNVGPLPIAIAFSPVNGDLLVAYQNETGIRHFNSDGTDLGLLGETATATVDPSDFAFMGENEGHDILIADLTGKVVRCDSDGTDCGTFSSQADDLLEAGSPTSVAVNPSADFTAADVMLADPVGERVISCNSNGNNCGTFGDTGDSYGSGYTDVFFAPAVTPTTTTTSTTSTTLEEN